VNYYFSDKAGLYAECWQYALERFSEVLFTDPDGVAPEVQLENYIRTLMRNVADKGEKGAFSRLYIMELVNPTGLIRKGWLDEVQANRQRLHTILTRIMGRTPSRETLVMCELSIASQCRNLLTINPDDMAYFFDQPMDEALIERMSAHITAFSLAGVRAVADR
jgi:AcrR family transcriptional regulator